MALWKLFSLTKKNKIRLVFYLAALAFLIPGLDWRLQTTRYEITSGKIQSRVRVMLIADLHSCHYGGGQRKLLDAIHKQNPDLILYAGDILDDHIPDENTVVLLAALRGKYPAYYVTGNHEFWSRESEKKISIMRQHGVKVLRGERETVSINGQTLNICGVDAPDVDFYTRPERTFSEQLDSLKNAADNGAFTILLAHRPELIETYGRLPFDLVLSGHAHGGQWRLPFTHIGLYSPDQGFFPKYPGGRYDINGMPMIVSRGLAKESTRVPKLYNRPELVVVDLASDR